MENNFPQFKQAVSKIIPVGLTSQIIPELSGSGPKVFDIIWCADKDGGDVTYRGYVKVGGKEYQIANLVNPREGGGCSGFFVPRSVLEFHKG